MPSIGGESVEKQEQTSQEATGENELKKAGVNEEEIDTERADEVEVDGEDGGDEAVVGIRPMEIERDEVFPCE